MITVMREHWADCIDEIMPMCQQVHNISERDIYGMPLDFDADLYQESEEADVFHCLVMRKNGKPIGFHWVVMYPLPRFKGCKQAVSDAIFVEPSQRIHAKKLIEYSENYIKNNGCKTWALSTLDPEYRGDMWMKKGFKKSETIFIKVM